MTVNLLYCAFNRREYTEATFAALLANTDWSQVGTLHVHDDASEDGTKEFLAEAVKDSPVEYKFESRRLRGPVAAMNRHLDLLPATDEIGAFVKIDNDFIVPPGWLDELLRVSYLTPGVDIIGMQPRYGPPALGRHDDRRVEEAPHIGGIGFMRHRAFDVCRPVAHGRFGFTEWQTRHRESRKGWLFPDIAGFCLDLIDLEPWATLSAEYETRGWQRPWSKYVDGGKSYYEWWSG